jgi:hypothetical protein
MKGLLCDIYEGKKIGNCSNYGISSKCKWVVLTGEGIPEIFEPNDEHPEVKLIIRDDLKLRSGHAFVNKNNEIKRILAVPLDVLESGKSYMFGGSFVYCSDSRFPFNAPIHLFDRVED